MRLTTLIIAAAMLFLFHNEASSEKIETQREEEAMNKYHNPFDYCKTVGTVDEPDERYTGDAVTYDIANKLKEEFGAPESAPIDTFMEGTTWRCMDGSVYACNVGANLPCSEKADMSKEPNEGMVNYCKEDPGSDFIPMYASGRATVYEWKCEGSTPVVVRQMAYVDQEGYIKGIWYKIDPPEKRLPKDVLRD